MENVSINPDSDRTWRALQLLFAAFAELPHYHDALVDLVVAVAAISPSDPENGTSNRMMKNLGGQWRDEYDGLQTHRHLRQRYDFEPALHLTGEKKLFNFVVCSAELANNGHARFVHMLGAFAFFELRDVFETTLEHYREEYLDLVDQEIVSPMQARSSDVETACQ